MKRLVCALAVPLLTATLPAATLHVSPNGNDSAPGTAAAPLRTPQGARDAVRAARKAGAIKAGEAVEVVFAPGDYVLEKGIVLEKEDGGSADAPVTWRSAQPRAARFTTARRVPVDKFSPVTDPAVLARLPEEARGRVLQADVTPYSPARIPRMAEHFGATPSGPLFFTDHAHATLARWPNADFTSFTQAVDHGTLLRRRPDGGNVRRPGAFVYSDPRAKRWNFSEGVWMNGYWTHDWDNHSVRAASYGAENGTNDVIRLAAEIPYGVKGRTWGRKERRFYVFNLLDELDAPGEWYLDRDRKILYWYPPAEKPSEAFLAFDGGPLLKGSDISNMRFKDLVFEYGLGDALSFRGNGVEVTGCRIGNFGGSGMGISGDRNVVLGCELHDLGRGGIYVSGGDRRKLLRADSLVEGNHIHHYALYKRTYASACDVRGCGVTARANVIHDAPHCAFLYGGNEHLFEYNNVYRVLMETGDAGAYYTGRDWTTMGNVLRYNYTHELGAEGELANTMGFYFDDCDCGDEVYGNVFWKVSRGIMIGGGREHPVRNNVFAECIVGLSIDCRGMTWEKWNNPTMNDPSWMLEKKALALDYTNGVWAARYPKLAAIMQDHPREPLYNPVENNVFIDCRRDLLALAKEATPIMDRMAPIRGNVAVNTFGTNGVACAKPDARLTAAFTVFYGAPGKPYDIGFANPRKGDFRLRPDASLLKACPEFKPIPVDRIPRAP